MTTSDTANKGLKALPAIIYLLFLPAASASEFTSASFPLSPSLPPAHSHHYPSKGEWREKQARGLFWCIYSTLWLLMYNLKGYFPNITFWITQFSFVVLSVVKSSGVTEVITKGTLLVAVEESTARLHRKVMMFYLFSSLSLSLLQVCGGG